MANMSMLSRVKSLFITTTPEKEQRSLSGRDPLGNPANSLSDIVDYETGTSGVKVTPYSALALSAVYACVKIISEDLSTCDINIEKKVGKQWVIDHDHYLNDFFQNPSPNYGMTTIREAYTGNAALTGNGIAPIKRHPRTGRIQEIEVRDFTEIYVYPTQSKNVVWYYTVDADGKSELLNSSQVIHLRNFSLNGRVGLSPVSLAGGSIGVGLNAINYADDNYANGGFGGGFIENPDSMSPEGRLKYSKQVKRAQAMGIPPVLDRGIKFVPNKISPKDVDLINTLNWSQTNVASIYRMPLNMLGLDDKVSGSNIEQQAIQYVTNCIRPWARKEEEELERKLLTSKELTNTRIKVDLDSLMRGDSTAMVNYFSQMLANRVLVPNEVRHKIGYPDRPGGDEPIDNQKSANETPGGPNIHTISKSNSDEQE